ncbi:MAG TPA: hypothetical protein VG820_11050 [Fimbriimonadaceae bacterium]|nr:hypothetical protein [Fimbriimonadaceae bacterium]
MKRVFWLAAILVAGCGGGQDDSRVVGSWKGEFVADSGKKSPGADLTLDKDHHFRELYRNLEITGSWKLDKGIVTLTVAKIGNLPVAEAQKKTLALAESKHNDALRAMAENMTKDVPLTLAPDGKTLEAHSDPAAHGHAVFTLQ